MASKHIRGLKTIHSLTPISNNFQILISDGEYLKSGACMNCGLHPIRTHHDHKAGGDRYHTETTKQSQAKNKTSTSRHRDGLGIYIVRSASKSSFVGLNKIASVKSRFGKLVWTVLTLGCLVGFLYQALKFASLYNSLPTEVRLNVENNGAADFPAVTVCNNNRIRKSEYCLRKPEKCNTTSQLFLSKREIFYTYIQALESNRSHSKAELGHSLQMIKGCYFKGMRVKLNTTYCTQRFIQIFDPDFGNCFTFRSRDGDNGFLYAAEADFWQPVNDLTLLLDTELEEYTEKSIRGLSVTVHSDGDFPDLLTDSIQVEAGFSYDFAVQQSITTLLPLPYMTNCTDFKQLPWANEKFQQPSRICTVGCSGHFQLKDCGYILKNISMFADRLHWNASTVTKAQKQCAKEVEENTKEYCRSLCGVPCKDIQFEVSVGKNILQKFQVVKFEEMKNFLDPKWENLTCVRIYYKTIERKIYEHKPMYDDLEFFSYMGGYSGVWLGFSLLNLFELLEILFISVKYACTRRKVNCKVKKVLKNSKQLSHKNCFYVGRWTHSPNRSSKVKFLWKKYCSC